MIFSVDGHIDMIRNGLYSVYADGTFAKIVTEITRIFAEIERKSGDKDE